MMVPAIKKTKKIKKLGKIAKKESKRLRLTKKKAKEIKKLGGEFAHDIVDIFQLLDKNNDDSTKVQEVFLKASLAAIVDLIPEIEMVAKKSKRSTNIYALNTLITQGREILIDLRSVSDSKYLSDNISRSVVDPMFLALSHTFINLMATLRDDLVDCGDNFVKEQVRKSVQKCASDFGQYLDVSSSSMKDALRYELE